MFPEIHIHQIDFDIYQKDQIGKSGYSFPPCYVFISIFVNSCLLIRAHWTNECLSGRMSLTEIFLFKPHQPIISHFEEKYYFSSPLFDENSFKKKLVICIFSQSASCAKMHLVKDSLNTFWLKWCSNLYVVSLSVKRIKHWILPEIQEHFHKFEQWFHN